MSVAASGGHRVRAQPGQQGVRGGPIGVGILHRLEASVPAEPKGEGQQREADAGREAGRRRRGEGRHPISVAEPGEPDEQLLPADRAADLLLAMVTDRAVQRRRKADADGRAFGEGIVGRNEQRQGRIRGRRRGGCVSGGEAKEGGGDGGVHPGRIAAGPRVVSLHSFRHSPIQHRPAGWRRSARRRPRGRRSCEVQRGGRSAAAPIRLWS